MQTNDLFSIQNISTVFNPFYRLLSESDNSLNKSFSSIDFTGPKLFDLDSLIIDGKIRCLFKPLAVKIEAVDGSWVIENERFRIVAIAPDYDTSLKDFAEQVVYLYEEYKNCADKDLTKDGLRFKHEIMGYFGGNQPK